MELQKNIKKERFLKINKILYNKYQNAYNTWKCLGEKEILLCGSINILIQRSAIETQLILNKYYNW